MEYVTKCTIAAIVIMEKTTQYLHLISFISTSRKHVEFMFCLFAMKP